MDGTLTVRAERDRYLARNALEMTGYGARVFKVRVLGVPLPFPNPGLLPWHDLHHVATGFGTDLTGEAEISAFELRSVGRNWIVTFLCVASILLMAPVAPRRILRAWRRSRGARSLYGAGVAYESLLDMDVASLRRLLKLPEEGIAR